MSCREPSRAPVREEMSPRCVISVAVRPAGCRRMRRISYSSEASNFTTSSKVFRKLSSRRSDFLAGPVNLEESARIGG